MIELVAIGDEVLHGYTVNANASFIAKTLLEHGFVSVRHTVVGDDEKAVSQVLQEALARSSIVITTGGLGPTCDDWTRKIVADLFRVALVEPEGLREKLISRFGKNFPTLEDQVLQVKGAHLFENRLGTASGFTLNNVICLPGVPQEMKAMLVEEVIPYLKATLPLVKRLFVEPIHFHTLKEPEVDAVLRLMQQKVPEVTYGIYPGYSTLTVHLCAYAANEEEKKRLFQPAKKLLLEQFGAFVYISNQGKLTEAVHTRLLEKGLTLSLAESCTGGALSASFVQYPDASQYLQGSIVSYSNKSKQELLGVDPELFKTVGAVSTEVTEMMALAAKKKFSTDIAIAVSGILGPGGATATKPVGTVSATIVCANQQVHSWTMHFVGNRSSILEQTIQAIHAHLLSLLT